MLKVPRVGQWYFDSGNGIPEIMCVHKKKKSECVHCTPGGNKPLEQVTQGDLKSPDKWHAMPFVPTTSQLNDFQKTIATKTALVYSNPTTTTAAGEADGAAGASQE